MHHHSHTQGLPKAWRGGNGSAGGSGGSSSSSSNSNSATSRRRRTGTGGAVRRETQKRNKRSRALQRLRFLLFRLFDTPLATVCNHSISQHSSSSQADVHARCIRTHARLHSPAGCTRGTEQPKTSNKAQETGIVLNRLTCLKQTRINELVPPHSIVDVSF